MDAFSDKSFTGKVAAIDTNGSITSGVTTYPVTIVFDSALSTIYPNMAVSVTIITDIKDNVLLVPTASIQTSNGASTIRIRKNGQIESVNVEIGSSNDTQIEIISGVSVGEEVITGQTGAATTTSSEQSTSPFGGRGFGGGGGVRIQR